MGEGGTQEQGFWDSLKNSQLRVRRGRSPAKGRRGGECTRVRAPEKWSCMLEGGSNGSWQGCNGKVTIDRVG